jgi:hypothetical protein
LVEDVEGSAEVLVERQPLIAAVAVGICIGFMSALFELFVNRWRIREVRLFDYFVLYPVIALAFGYSHLRLVRDPPRQPAAIERDPGHEARRTRYFAIGWAAGIVFALISTLVDIAWRGYYGLPQQLTGGLFFYPAIGACFGVGLSRLPGEPAFPWPRPRLSLKAMMIVVAYLAVVFALGTETGKLGGAAKQYHNKYLSAVQMLEVFGPIAEKSRRDAPVQLRSAQLLRAGEIPREIDPKTISFLESFQKTATPAEKKARFDSIAGGQELQGRAAESNIAEYSKLMDYYTKLKEKYARAERQPWLPVEPDPPPP